MTLETNTDAPEQSPAQDQPRRKALQVRRGGTETLPASEHEVEPNGPGKP